MIGLWRAACLLLCVASMVAGNAAGAQAASETAPERLAGEARIGSQPPFSIHLELLRSGNAVTGIVSIPGSRFDFEGRGGDTPVTQTLGESQCNTLLFHAKTG